MWIIKGKAEKFGRLTCIGALIFTGAGISLSTTSAAEQAAGNAPSGPASSEAEWVGADDSVQPVERARLNRNFISDESRSPRVPASGVTGRSLLSRSLVGDEESEFDLADPEPIVPPAAPTRATGTLVQDPGLAQVNPAFLTPGATGFDEITDDSAKDKRFKITPHISVGLRYDSNIFVDDENSKGDLILTVAPGVSVRYGSSQSTLELFADYTAGANFFSDETSLDGIDHFFRLGLTSRLNKLTVGFRVGVELVDGSDVEAGERVKRTNYYAGFTTEYQISEKTSVEFNGDYRLSDYNALLDSDETRAQIFLNYLLLPKVRVGVGGTLGFLDVDGSPGQTYEQALLRATYTISGRLTLNGNVGAEFRQFGGERDDLVTPVFGAGFAWTPFDGTMITVDGRRRIYGSASLGRQDYAATGGVVNLRQRFLSDFFFSLALGYEHASYFETVDGVNADREDNYFYIRPGLQWQIRDRWTMGIFYTYSENLSDGEGSNSFSRDQIGLQTSIAF